jgi:hypothetical protein
MGGGVVSAVHRLCNPRIDDGHARCWRSARCGCSVSGSSHSVPVVTDSSPPATAWVATMRHRVVDLVASHPYRTVSLIARITLTLGRSSPVVGRSSRGPVGGRTTSCWARPGRDAVDSYRPAQTPEREFSVRVTGTGRIVEERERSHRRRGARRVHSHHRRCPEPRRRERRPCRCSSPLESCGSSPRPPSTPRLDMQTSCWSVATSSARAGQPELDSLVHLIG